MDTYVAKVQIGNNINDLAPIASTLFGVCGSNKSATTKMVTCSKFDNLIHGATIFVKFENGNSVATGVRLQVGATLAYEVRGDCLCDEEAVVAFTFDEMDATHKYWRATTSGITESMKNYINHIINTSTDTPDVIILKGGVGAGSLPGVLPNSDYEVGWAYYVAVDGIYAGQTCEVGDLIIAITDAPANQLVINNSHWIVVQHKLQNVVFNTSTAIANHVAIFDDNTGKHIIDSGFTLGKSVPADAKFTDTTYTNGTGLELENNIFSVIFGTTPGTVAAGNDSRFNSYASNTHTHGNISNDGTLGNGNNLLITDNGAIVAGPAIGNQTNQYLSNAGTWVAMPTFPAQFVTSVNGKSGEVTLTLQDFNVDVMRFVGQATVDILPESRTNPAISAYDFSDRHDGDIILGKTDGREYIWVEDSGWILLGQEASEILDSNLLSIDSNENSNVWISQITQNTDRTITIKRGALDTSGTWAGNAATATAATQFVNAQKVYVNLSQQINLSQPNTITTIQGGSATAEVLGIHGILNIANGGTGVDSFTPNQVILSNNVNGIATSLITREYSDSSSAGALNYNSENFVTERDIYYGLPFINNVHTYDASDSIFAPTTGGLENQILIAHSSTTAPVWAAAATLSSVVSEIASATSSAFTILTLGNNASSTTTNPHSEGKILLYSGGTGAHSIVGLTTASDYEHHLINSDGYLVQIPNLIAVGSNTNPVYVNANGEIIALRYEPNRLYYSASAAVGQTQSDEFLPSGHYANATQISINSTSAPSVNDVLLVNGNSSFTGITRITDNTAATGSTGALIVTGGIRTASNLHVDTTSSLVGKVSIGAPISTIDNNYILTIHGSAKFYGNTGDIAFLDQETANGEISMIFKPAVTARGEIGTINNRWKSAAFANNISINNGNSSIELNTKEGNNYISQIEITSTAPSFKLISSSNNNNYTWFIDHTAGVFSIHNSEAELTGQNRGFTIEPRLYVGASIGTNDPVYFGLFVDGTTKLNDSVGIGINPETEISADQHILKINGSTLIVNESDVLIHIDIPNNTIPFNISPDDTHAGSFGLLNHKWDTGYFYDTIEIGPRDIASDTLTGILLESDGTMTINTDGSSIVLNTESNSAAYGYIDINSATSAILLNTTALNSSDWAIKNESGAFSLSNSSTSTILNGTDNGFEMEPRLYINSTIPATPTYALSVTGDAYVSTKVHIGAQETYGSPYLPIYWLDGVPTPVTGSVHQNTFTFASGATTVTLSSAAYSASGTTETYVTQIVVTDGEENLNGIISWTFQQMPNSQSIGQIILTTPATSGVVTGYILTELGVTAPTYIPSSTE